MTHHPEGQGPEFSRFLTSDNLSNSVTASPRHYRSENRVSLHAPDGERKYLNRHERQRALAAMEMLPRDRSLFAQVLAWTGARVSEALALTPQSFQLDDSLVTIVTLKRRGQTHIREVPLPPRLMAALRRHFRLRAVQQDPLRANRRLWPFCRMTAWRIIKNVMKAARIIGRKACPRGLRHGFGTGTLQSGVPLNIIQRWMGHARMSTTAIYAAVCGREELSFARRYWRESGDSIE